MAAKNSLYSPDELHTILPLEHPQKQFIDQSRQEVMDILSGKDQRMLLIVGPCSIHDIIATKEYAMKLKNLSDELRSSFLILMRTYFEKPRTRLGWKGLLHDPHLDGGNEIGDGLKLTRKLLLDLAEMGVPTATEFLDPASPEYYGDLITWGCIGARTSTSQIHRQIASGLPMPIAFKNSTDGSIEGAVHGVQVAHVPHTYIGMEGSGRVALVHSHGNPFAHLMLRGGEKGPNYDTLSVQLALNLLEKAGCNRRILIDCSHDNCRKIPEKQVDVFRDVIEQIHNGNAEIKGLMLESHLKRGAQQLGSGGALEYGKSITDPCLDWESTESIILEAAHKLYSSNNLAALKR